MARRELFTVASFDVTLRVLTTELKRSRAALRR
jgi:hypothetical protein